VDMGRMGDYLLQNGTENDVDLHGEHAMRIEAVIVRNRVDSFEGSVVANRVTIVARKDMRCHDGDCPLGGGDLEEVPVISVDARRMGLKARRMGLRALTIRGFLLEALNIARLVKVVRPHHLLAVVRFEGSVFAKRATIVARKGMRFHNGDCLLGGGNLGGEVPMISVDARRMDLKALLIMIWGFLLEALNIARLVMVVHPDHLLAVVRFEGSVFAKRATIVARKGMRFHNGDCLLGGGNLGGEVPMISVDARRMDLKALLIMIWGFLLEALNIARPVKMVHLDALLADVREEV
jgi:hypothetical protein